MNEKITPLEALHKERLRLQLKSEALTAIIEEDIKYLQYNAPILIGKTVTDAILSKMPPLVQNLFKKKESKSLDSPLSNRLSGYEHYADMALEFVPFLVKGSKGLIATVLLKKIKNLFFRK